MVNFNVSSSSADWAWRGLVGKGDKGGRVILCEFDCRAGLIVIKLDVVDGGTLVVGGRNRHASDSEVTCEVNGSYENILLLLGASRGAGAYELVKLRGTTYRGLVLMAWSC